MRLPDATLIAQYPEAHVLEADVRKDRIPCILPHVVFINCRIFLASVDDDESGAPGLAAIGFLMGDRGRDNGLAVRWRREDCASGAGLGIIDGKPIEVESTPLSCCTGGDCKEPTRFRFLDVSVSGDFSLKRSSSVRVRGRICDSLLPVRIRPSSPLRDVESGARDLEFGLEYPDNWANSPLELL